MSATLRHFASCRIDAREATAHDEGGGAAKLRRNARGREVACAQKNEKKGIVFAGAEASEKARGESIEIAREKKNDEYTPRTPPAVIPEA